MLFFKFKVLNSENHRIVSFEGVLTLYEVTNETDKVKKFGLLSNIVVIEDNNKNERTLKIQSVIIYTPCSRNIVADSQYKMNEVSWGDAFREFNEANQQANYIASSAINLYSALGDRVYKLGAL